MSQSDRSRPLNIWIQSDLGALAMLARGAVATPPLEPPVPPTLAPAHAATIATAQVVATRAPRLEREKKAVIGFVSSGEQLVQVLVTRLDAGQRASRILRG